MTTTQARSEETALARIQALQERLDATPESPATDLAGELVGAVVSLYGDGLERIVAALGDRAQELAADPLVATLLLIHDLHPVPLAERVQAALESVRPYMESHGGNVELLSLERGIARIHLRGSCSDCSASSVTLELAIKQALEEMAPDLEGLQVEGMAEQTVPGQGLPMATGIDLPVISSAPPGWRELPNGVAPAPGERSGAMLNGHPLVIANVDGTLLAFQDRCSGCGEPLHDGPLEGGILGCEACGRTFLLNRAGRSLDDENLQLEPVPLLRDGGQVRVAV
ncbi:MAG TPA: NifU family protein [Solirubrobacteraceae bacterium]|nr:NifU family protein [Solirubrobacteraceae bacterium]